MVSKLPYLHLDAIIASIDAPNREPLRCLYAENEDPIRAARGSKSKHQAWEGGYVDHVVECCNIAALFYKEANKKRTLPFSLSDVYLVLLLHDLEKPWKHAWDGEKWIDDKIIDPHTYIYSLVKRYGVELSDDHKNALEYIHGEGADYNPRERLQGPLAAFCHMCDVMSARVWHNEPKTKGTW